MKKVSLAEGQKAPFSGVLLSRTALAKLITDYEAKVAQAALQLQKEQLDAKARYNAAQMICKTQIEAERVKAKNAAQMCVAQKRILQGALKRANRPLSWHQSPYFHLGLGVVIGGGLCAASVASVSALRSP